MRIKRVLLATTSLVALGLTVAPASAATAMMGDVSLGYGYNWMNFDGFGSSWDANYSAVFGNGRVNLPYSDTVNVQLDIDGRSSLDAVFGNKAAHFGLGGHVNYRDAQGLLGVFAATGRVEDVDIYSAPVFMAGFDGQYYCDQWTLRGQIGYLDSSANDSGESFLLKDAGFIRAGADYYASKKLKLSGGIAYINGEAGLYGVDVEQWAWNLGAHYWFGGTMPVSGFIEYRGRTATSDFGGEGDGTVDQNTLNAGVVFHFGGDGFEDADRKGASNDLPDFDWYRLFVD